MIRRPFAIALAAVLLAAGVGWAARAPLHAWWHRAEIAALDEQEHALIALHGHAMDAGDQLLDAERTLARAEQRTAGGEADLKELRRHVERHRALARRYVTQYRDALAAARTRAGELGPGYGVMMPDIR